MRFEGELSGPKYVNSSTFVKVVPSWKLIEQFFDKGKELRRVQNNVLICILTYLLLINKSLLEESVSELS